jgi:hypothetical protein
LIFLSIRFSKPSDCADRLADAVVPQRIRLQAIVGEFQPPV